MNLPDEVKEAVTGTYSGLPYGTVPIETSREYLEKTGTEIAAAAYRKGREDALAEARERIEALPGPADHWTAENKVAFGAGKEAASDALSSLAGEKEKGCPDCGKTVEGGYDGERLLCGNDFHDLFPDGPPAGTGKERNND